MEGVSINDYIEHGIFLKAVAELSCIRMKKIKERHDGDLALVQLTIENHAIVYNL